MKELDVKQQQLAATMADTCEQSGATHTLVECYKNRNRRLWNIRDITTGRVIGYCQEMLVVAPRSGYSPGERRRMDQRQRRTVHAWIVGAVVAITGFRPQVHGTAPELVQHFSSLPAVDSVPEGARRVDYNPRIMDAFQYLDNGHAFAHADIAHFRRDLTVWAKTEDRHSSH